MKRIIDIHMHVIPDADDGPDTMEEALELLRRSSEQGVTDIIATSHDSAFFGKAEQTVLKYLDLKRAAAEANIPVSLYLGAELYLDLKHMESDILPKLKDGSYSTLNGTKYVLVEFSTREREEDICACLDCLLEEGYYSETG